MISASRRTDIPAFYSDWFFNRLKEGYVLVRNPMNIHQVSRIALDPDVVDFIVFWTKNPKPMLNKLYELQNYNYYFQFTLNSYYNDIEPNVPSKGKEVIQTFKTLFDIAGRERVAWRYDPILINQNIPLIIISNISEDLQNYLTANLSTALSALLIDTEKMHQISDRITFRNWRITTYPK